MMVVFVSQCEKKALARTRRVLDAFADRIGDNSWQTVITQEGLLAVRKLLRKTASKNTAVSCHWIRSRARTELVWVVGCQHKFNQEGRVPVNRTAKRQLHNDHTADWLLLPVIRALTCVAALLHDWGKSNARFQKKLSASYKGSQADRLRHEWVSCLLLKALIFSTNNPESDNDWLQIFKSGALDEEAIKQSVRTNWDKPLADLPDTAKLVAWLIVSHHKLPRNTKDTLSKASCGSLGEMLKLIDKAWGYENPDAGETKACLEFPQGLLAHSGKWLSQLKRWSSKLLDLQASIAQAVGNGSYRVVLHHARLSLMLGDYSFSYNGSDKASSWVPTTSLLANTQKDKSPKQQLDQHLVGVCERSRDIIKNLPLIENQLERSMNTTALKQNSSRAYAWQNTAAKKIRAWSKEAYKVRKGFFAVNMASTGCGKTFANAKIMMALSEDGDSLRYTLALGLRTLTLQTGDEYRKRIFTDGDGDDLAVLIGSQAIADLHAQDRKNRGNSQEQQEHGSESIESLLAGSDEIIYQDEFLQKELAVILRESKDRKLLYAPVLVCTLDHIIAATETMQGGRYILPALRLLSSDLVIDEVDDFTGSDLIAIGRLVHLAGMLGRKVMLSSATIPPAMAEGYFHAYREGWQLYCKTRSASPVIGCAWIDEFSTQVKDIGVANHVTEMEEQGNGSADVHVFKAIHGQFVNVRVAHLTRQPPKRKAILINCQSAMAEPTIGGKQKRWFNLISQAALDMHQKYNTVDNKTGLKISFGVIRIANINPCVQLARYLLDYDWPATTEVRVMPYHSRQVLLLRHEQESHLDQVLKRKETAGEQPHAFLDPVIRQHLDTIAENQSGVEQVLFILVATPVEEVGRDHDFDWAIIEPSSYRSIIQLAGRVKRHRDGGVEYPNIGILQYNWRTVKEGDKEDEPRFYFPGYEPEPRKRQSRELVNGEENCLRCHDLYQVIDVELIQTRLDSTPRIQSYPAGKAIPMAWLEHAVMASQLTFYKGKGPETLQGYIGWYWHLTALPQYINRFRQRVSQSIRLYRVVSEEGKAWFTEFDSMKNLKKDNKNDCVNRDAVYQIETVPLTTRQSERLWMQRNYLMSWQEQMEHRGDLSKTVILGELNLDVYPNAPSTSYEYNDNLGLYVKESDDA